MKPSERFRARLAFGILGAVPVFLAGWFGWLQVAQAGELRGERAPLPLVASTADRQAWRTEEQPAPRGRIVDRNGKTLAADREQYEVRARFAIPPKGRKDVVFARSWLSALVGGLAAALVADPSQADRGEAHAHHLARLTRIVERDLRLAQLPPSGEWPQDHPGMVDMLVTADIDRLPAIEALRRLPEERRFAAVHLDFLHGYGRSYPDRDLTFGLVGHCETRWQTLDDGRRELRAFGIGGLETFAALDAGAPAERRILTDKHGRPYFVAPAEHPQSATVLHATLDLELQRIAARELRLQAEAKPVEEQPLWGALVLVELDSGDLLAAASWRRGKQPAETSFAPYQNQFEPGSIVKPLVLAYAHEVGAIGWDQSFDCNPHGGEYRERIAGLGRRAPVRDDHDCDDLTPHGIIVNSSNIGAAYCGLELSREQWQDYMRVYGFGASLGVGLPHESLGGNHPRSFAADVPLRSFRANSAISFSFGYELQVTAMQVARAYLRLFRGFGSELRVVRQVDVDGRRLPVPTRIDQGPKLRPEVLAAVRLAMVDVISDDPHATARTVHAAFLRDAGVDLHGLLGGKTGTAASRVGIGNGQLKLCKNASFVGFLPAEAPRWLAVCVLQKDDSARFYGASYAAPPAAKLLLQCQQLAERRQLLQEPCDVPGGQTRSPFAPPGTSGWSPRSPGEAARDTRQGG